MLWWVSILINKTEWTREEDEKPLHLAKLMPTQWRTIALSLVGLFTVPWRYEKLVDVACVKEENYEPNDKPKEVASRTEIDPNPESKTRVRDR
ncbi:hypothetical protein IFM89_032437 [Coptis chinensis]|uniref:Uncharacterized protein n=1 Tax=Coptis chinensis TaxID=261450 RepID=A0A835M057_9MAGN|nr:hypothetical protein IFM89_032437 [Coptis chinensis]